MFYLSLLFLTLLAASMVLWIDVPRVVDVADGEQISVSEAEVAFEQAAYRLGRWCGVLLLALWPVFWIEQIWNFTRADNWAQFRAEQPYAPLFCLVPPLRLCAHVRDTTERLWLPWLGWQTVNRQLERKLEKHFSVPMIGIALLILPVLGLQFLFQDRIVEYPKVRFALHFGTGLIWFAFAFEFIVMVSVAERKFQYCKKHWLDLIIILLPLISFLRTLRLLRASKMIRIGKLQQLSKVVRVYRLRAVTMRGLRALMLLEVVHRLLKTTPEKRIKKLKNLVSDKERELAELHEEIARLEKSLEP